MYKIIALLLTICVQTVYANNLDTSQQMQNVTQQTGGNYIYAENGKLTFNLEPSLFENRTWQFNQQYDAAIVGFETKLPIKTKHSSSFHSYELAMGYHVYEYSSTTGEMKFVRSTTERPPQGELMYPVYTPRIDQGRTYHVWLPAAIWVVRIVGVVARQVVPPIITRAVTACMASLACKATIAGTTVTAGILCGFNYSDPNVNNHDGSLCKKARKEGWQPNTNSTNGETNSMDRVYPYTVTVTYGSYDLHQKCPECDNDYRVEKFGADSFEEAEAMLNKKCKSITTYTDRVENSQWYLLSGKVKEIELTKGQGGSYSCAGVAIDDEYNEEFHVSAFGASIENTAYTENMQIHDINNLIMEDFKKDPTPYINDNGQVGKELRDNIKSSAAIQKKDGTSGTINATSEPYLDPNSGKVVQDILQVDSGRTFDVPPAGGGSSGGSGSSSGSGSSGTTNSIPTGTNNVNVSTIERPDLINEAKPAENNSPNGTGVGTNGTTGETSSKGEETKTSEASGVGGLDCEKEHKGTLACAGLGSVAEGDFDSIKVPTKTDNTTYEPDMFLPTTGVCPAPKVFHVWGKPFEISYEPLCRFMEMVRFIILAAFILMSAYLTFGSLRRE